MLNIYYDRESADKEKFIYETIGERGYSASSPVIVLVPDQYTLEAERAAFRVTGRKAMIGLDIYSVSRLGHNILESLGKGDVSFVDKYGRQMLLTRIMAGIKDELEVYGGSSRKPSFIEEINNFISELKQYGITPEDLGEMIEKLGGSGALQLKLSDILKIYSAYDKSIEGKYTDSEDYVDLFVSKVQDSELLKKAAIWVYGFDSFAPKTRAVLTALMKVAREVNVVLTYDKGKADEDLFELTGRVMDDLRDSAKEEGVPVGEIKRVSGLAPDGTYEAAKKSKEIKYIESGLFAPVPVPLKAKEEDADAEGITITEAANFQNEAESAAAYILHLMRDKGYRARDIAVICNDQEKRADVLGRVFDESGIPLFIDRKRDLSGSSVSVFLVSMLYACIRGFRTEDIMRALKTGLSPLDQEEVEKLENYAIRYKIERGRWTKPLEHGAADYSEEELDEIRDIKERAISDFVKLDGILREKGTYGEFLRRLYGFLVNDIGIMDQLNALMKAQEAVGLRDLADETSQVFGMLMNILDQINDILGEEPFDAVEFVQIFETGLRQIELGVLPSTPDDMMLGTMQRTRTGPVKAVIIVGANEGVLPQGQADRGLFAEREIERMEDSGYEICKVNKVRQSEEKLAMYRNLSHPKSELWVSYATTGESGDSIRPSELIEDLKTLFPYIEIEKDILNRDDQKDMISGRVSTLRHLTDAMTRAGRGEAMDPLWLPVYEWYKKNDRENWEKINGELHRKNEKIILDKGLSGLLLSSKNGGNSLSPSRIERYARCPFGYFVDFALAPEERRVFEAGAREIGDVYHEALMKMTERISREGCWQDITESEIDKLVDEILEKTGKTYRDGVFTYSDDDVYRKSRMKKTLGESMKLLVRHARAGKIKSSSFEAAFGRGAGIKPVEVPVSGGKYYIEGKIDRLDILDNDRVKIIDYKTTVPGLSERRMISGYSLQLMLYMKAAREEVRKPAGIFYFHIGHEDVETKDMKTSIENVISDDEMKKMIRESFDTNTPMAGLSINDAETIEEITGKYDDEPYVNVAGIGFKNGGALTKNSLKKMMTDDEFDELQEKVMDTVKALADDIREGIVTVRPMKLLKENENACANCEYKSICGFDVSFDGCRYNVIK